MAARYSQAIRDIELRRHMCCALAIDGDAARVIDACASIHDCRSHGKSQPIKDTV